MGNLGRPSNFDVAKLSEKAAPRRGRRRLECRGNLGLQGQKRRRKRRGMEGARRQRARKSWSSVINLALCTHHHLSLPGGIFSFPCECHFPYADLMNISAFCRVFTSNKRKRKSDLHWSVCLRPLTMVSNSISVPLPLPKVGYEIYE